MGVKQDTMNLLRNAPMFGYGLFPDAAIMMAEQDIQTHEASSVAQGPDPVLLSTLAGEAPTNTNPTNAGIKRPLLPLNKLPNDNSSLGVSLVGVVPGDTDVDGVPTLVFPSPSLTSTINDNYCVGPTSMHVNSVQLVPNFQNKVFQKTQLLKGSLVQTVSSSVVSKTLNPVISGTVNLDVSYPVVNLAPTVLSHWPPQKKGVSPSQSQNKIKHVKGVCCVSSCLSAPHILTVPNAVSRQNVGGRLQNFWQVWQKMGVNPRVVSLLRDGYSLPFKQRPILTRFPVVQCRDVTTPNISCRIIGKYYSCRHRITVELK